MRSWRQGKIAMAAFLVLAKAWEHLPRGEWEAPGPFCWKGPAGSAPHSLWEALHKQEYQRWMHWWFGFSGASAKGPPDPLTQYFFRYNHSEKDDSYSVRRAGEGEFACPTWTFRSTPLLPSSITIVWDSRPLVLPGDMATLMELAAAVEAQGSWPEQPRTGLPAFRAKFASAAKEGHRDEVKAPGPNTAHFRPSHSANGRDGGPGPPAVRIDGRAVEVDVQTPPCRVLVRLTLDKDFDSFTPEEQAGLFERLGMIIQRSGGLFAQDKVRGSVVYTLQLTPEEAERLLAAVEAGKLKEFSVLKAAVVSQDTVENEAASQLSQPPQRGTSTNPVQGTERLQPFRTQSLALDDPPSHGPGELPSELVCTDAWQRLFSLISLLVHRWCRRAFVPEADIDDVVQAVYQAAAHGEQAAQLYAESNGKVWVFFPDEAPIEEDERVRFRGRQPRRHAGVEGAPIEEDRRVLFRGAVELRLPFRRAVELLQSEVDEDTWQAFWRVEVEGRSAAEVAADLGMSVEAVYRAKSFVRERLHDVFPDLI
jgi:RNA polymerase sigma-70 factor (ECF subfamily)